MKNPFSEPSALRSALAAALVLAVALAVTSTRCGHTTQTVVIVDTVYTDTLSAQLRAKKVESAQQRKRRRDSLSQRRKAKVVTFKKSVETSRDRRSDVVPQD